MKKVYLFVIMLIACFSTDLKAQYLKEGTPLQTRVKINADNGRFKGFLVTENDSLFMISISRKYSEKNMMTIPVNSLQQVRVKEFTTGGKLLMIPAAFTLGFILTAGLTRNPTDRNYDGETSFWELLFNAIEGSTSSNRRRRNTALIVGGSGGLLLSVALFATTKGLTLRFPLGDRRKYYSGQRYKVSTYLTNFLNPK